MKYTRQNSLGNIYINTRPKGANYKDFILGREGVKILFEMDNFLIVKDSGLFVKLPKDRDTFIISSKIEELYL